MSLGIFLGASVLPVSAASLTSAQIQSVLSLLSSFGVNQATINSVSTIISGQTVITTPPAATTSPLILSLDSSSPSSSTIVASQGQNGNDAYGTAVLVFDLSNHNSNAVMVRNLGVQFGSAAINIAPAYLFSGSTQIASAATVHGTVVFENINESIPANSSMSFKVTVDVKGVTSPIVVSPSVNYISASNSNGNVIYSGSAVGNTITFTNAAPLVSIINSPTISSTQSPSQNGHSTTTLIATFNVQVQALGGNFYFGNPNSKPFDFSVYKNGSTSDMSAYQGTESFSVPSSGVVTNGLPANIAFELLQNNTVQIPVTFSFVPAGLTASIAVSLSGVTVTNSSGQANVITNIVGTRATPTIPVSVSQGLNQNNLNIGNVYSGINSVLKFLHLAQ